MATYGLKYQCTFDPVKDPPSPTPVYKIEILEKDYSGSVTDVIASTIPALHQWFEDDPKAPIKGSSFRVALINKNGSLPLETFFSTDDDQFKGKFYWLTELKFEGFLVQDDCSEIMLDSTHEINLSFTDNLGLLKDVPLDKAKVVYDLIDSVTDTWSLTAPHTLTLPAGIAAFVHPGDKIRITNVIFVIEYHVTETTGGVDMIVSENVSTGSPGATDDIEVYRPRDFDDKVTLAFIFEQCLWATGLELHTHIWGRIIEVTQNTTTSFIDQTLIDPATFLKDDDTAYDDCYTVLEKVLSRFKMTLFQAKGVWNIVRWDELRYASNVLPVFVYDTDFNIDGSNTMDPVFEAGIGEATQAEATPERKRLRPFLSVKETFNYRQPGQLLRNYDLQKLGQLLDTYNVTIWISLDGRIHYSNPGGTTTTSFQTYFEYEAPWWYYTNAYPTATGGTGAAVYFIRVVYDDIGNEIDRYMVLIYNGIHSYKVEGARGDRFTFSFSIRTRTLNCDGENLILIIKLTNGTDTVYALSPTDSGATFPGWGPTIGYTNVISGDSSAGFVKVSADSLSLPFDGLLYFYLLQPAVVAFDEVHINDIRLEYSFNINESTKIIGHTHKSEQVAIIKQVEDEEIFIDTSPRNSIAGTLFLDSVTGVLQDKTRRWQHPYLSQSLLLGDLITFEQLFWRRVPRTILEGTFKGIQRFSEIISMMAVYKYTYYPDLNFVFGTLEIDYRNDKFTGTLWEIWEDSEADADLSKFYQFKYLYSTK